jgi:acetyl esterase/lipase
MKLSTYINIFLITLVIAFIYLQVSAKPINSYKIQRDIIYHTVNNYQLNQLKLDLHQNQKPGLHPVALIIHGGGWVQGSKEEQEAFLAPYVNWGFSVVNINYRLASTAKAPAAVEDCMSALRWVIKNGKKYNFDVKKIVTTGFSAGGHLALMVGMITPTQVAAIINFAGITDVTDLLSGTNQKSYALQWFGEKITKEEMAIAKRVSPINYVRSGLPPILTIHGNQDTVVPYSHGVRLHAAVEKVGVSNRLFTVYGAGHGNFSKKQEEEIYAVVKKFLMTNRIGIISSQP